MKVLHRKLWRDLWQSKGQVLAVLAVITCGIAVYVAFLSSYYNLILSRDAYYAQYRFHDFSIQLEKAPQTAVLRIKELPGVRDARGRIVKDVNLALEGRDDNKVGRLISLPRTASQPIDGVHLVSGRLLSEQVDECLVNDAFLQANQLSLGDRLQVTVNGRRQSLKIVGTVYSPEYIYAIRNAAEMFPNPEKFGLIWVQTEWAESRLDLQNAINEIVAEVYDPEALDALLDQADKRLKSYGIHAKVKREQQLSHWYFNSEIEGLEVSATVTPAIFLMIAALILVILLTRMVRRERPQIGLLKAYGYSTLQLAAHYLKFAGLIGALGGLLGFVFGQWMGSGMIQLYVSFYTLPVLRYQFYPGLLLNAMAISMGCAMAAALLVVRTVAGISPATAMRAESPRSAHKTWLEHLPWLWQRLSFTHKIIFRNMARYPLRSGFTVLGVMLSTVIVLMGYFSGDAVQYMLEHQFEKVQREDLRVAFYLERGSAALNEARRWPHVRRVEPLLNYPFELRKGWRKKEVLVMGLPDQMQLFQLLDTENQPVRLRGNGLTLLDITARELGVTVGDTLTLKPLVRFEREREVQVEAIVRQYIGGGAYMRLEALSRLLGESQAFSTLLIQTDSPDPAQTQALQAVLKEIPAVASVEVKQDSLDNFNQTIGESMGLSMFFLSFFAGIIAISVIYNATAINITERSREMASLQVLGYTPREVGRMVFNENLYLSLLGLLLGLPMGTWMCMALTQAYTTDVFRFPFYLSPRTYVITSLTILCYVLVTNFLSRQRIRRLDLVDVLKSRE